MTALKHVVSIIAVVLALVFSGAGVALAQAEPAAQAPAATAPADGADDAAETSAPAKDVEGETGIVESGLDTARDCRKFFDLSDDNLFVKVLGGAVANNLCGSIGLGASAGKAAGKLLGAFWDDPVGKFTKAVMEGNTQMLQMVMTFWMDYSFNNSGQLDANVMGVKNIVLGIAGFLLIASFMVGGARLAASRQRGLQDGMEEIGSVMGRWIIFSAGIPSIVAGALLATDELARLIMENFGATSPDTFVEIASIEDAKMGPVVMLLLAGVALAGSAMQFVALVIRVLLLPIAAGLAPAFAAASFTETGRNGLNHLVAYIISALLFKPIAALLYCVALWYATLPGSGDTFMGAIVNALMIGIAGFVAPALVRSVVPAVAQAGGGSAAGLLAGAAAGAGALAAGVGAMAGGMAKTAGGGAGYNAATPGSGTSSALGSALGATGSKGAAGGAGSAGSSGGSGAAGKSGSVSTKAVASGAQGGKGTATSSRAGRFSPGTSSRPAGAVGAGVRATGRFMSSAARVGAQGAAATARGATSLGVHGSQLAANSARGLGNTLEGSIGYPGQIHR